MCMHNGSTSAAAQNEKIHHFKQKLQGLATASTWSMSTQSCLMVHVYSVLPNASAMSRVGMLSTVLKSNYTILDFHISCTQPRSSHTKVCMQQLFTVFQVNCGTKCGSTKLLISQHTNYILSQWPWHASEGLRKAIFKLSPNARNIKGFGTPHNQMWYNKSMP